MLTLEYKGYIGPFLFDILQWEMCLEIYSELVDMGTNYCESKELTRHNIYWQWNFHRMNKYTLQFEYTVTYKENMLKLWKIWYNYCLCLLLWK